MHPVIRSISSSDVPNLETWAPTDPRRIYVALSLVIGPADAESGDLFQIVVATPEALAARDYLGACFSGRHYLIAREYDWSTVRAQIESLVARCASERWEESARLLARYFQWEFEDYAEDVQPPGI